MTAIRQEDLIESVADALQYISYYHPVDYIKALGAAYRIEQSPAARDAIAQILTNSRMCAEGKRPICQDTGIVVVFMKVGMEVRWGSATMSVAEMVNEGVRRAYLDPDNKLRASILSDPAGGRKNTKDNTPAVIHYEIVPGNTIDIKIAGERRRLGKQIQVRDAQPFRLHRRLGHENRADDGRRLVSAGHARHRHRRHAEKAMLLAKEALMEPIDMHELKARGPKNRIEELRVELYDKVNALGIGAQGLGGLTTVLDVKILDYPTHAASLPVAMIPNCAATRHAFRARRQRAGAA